MSLIDGLTKGLAESILFRSPAWMRDSAVSAIGFLENRKRYGGAYGRAYRQYCENLSLNRAELEAIQQDRLRRLLIESISFSPWYQRQARMAGISDSDLLSEPTHLLRRMPMLKKSDLKSNLGEIVSTDPNRTVHSIVSTSGTSGAPMDIPYDAEGRQTTFAEWSRYHRWLGLNDQFRSVRFSGRIVVSPRRNTPPFWAYNRASRQLFMSSYHLKPDLMSAYVEKLNQFQPELIDGYPSAIALVAKHILTNSVPLRFTPAAISVTAETLSERQREDIERAFSCPVHNQYASSEGAPWIVQCDHGSMHLWIDTGVFEFINRRTLPSGMVRAELVVTSFRNFKTPLIRYRIGDHVELFPDKVSCPCGSAFPIVSGVLGREDDLLYTEEKGYVGRMDPAYKGILGIRESKIVQHSEGQVEILIVREAGFDERQQRQLKKNVRDRLGQSVRVRITFTDRISAGPSGKIRSVERRFSIGDHVH